MKASKAYLHAAAVLSGATIPKIDRNRVELKMCEWCPHLFTRPIGSDEKYCHGCKPGDVARKSGISIGLGYRLRRGSRSRQKTNRRPTLIAFDRLRGIGERTAR